MIDSRDRCPPWLIVSRETLANLEHFADMVIRWSNRINLISRTDEADIWQRHILDSAQIFGLAPMHWRHWVDMGSGGGFPGVVVAIMASAHQHVTLIESDQRKSAFLRTVAIELKLPVTVKTKRISTVEPLLADVVSARALAPLKNLLEMAKQHVNPEGVCLFSKGSNVEAELAAVQDSWNMTVQKHMSKTSASGTILEIGAISRATG